MSVSQSEQEHARYRVYCLIAALFDLPSRGFKDWLVEYTIMKRRRERRERLGTKT